MHSGYRVPSYLSWAVGNSVMSIQLVWNNRERRREGNNYHALHMFMYSPFQPISERRYIIFQKDSRLA